MRDKDKDMVGWNKQLVSHRINVERVEGIYRCKTWRAKDNNKMREGMRKKDKHVRSFFAILKLLFITLHLKMKIFALLLVFAHLIAVFCLHTTMHNILGSNSFVSFALFSPSVCCSQSYSPVSFLNTFLTTIHTLHITFHQSCVSVFIF